MTAVWAFSGTLFLFVLFGGSYSRHIKTGFDASLSSGFNYGANTASGGKGPTSGLGYGANTVSRWEGPTPGFNYGANTVTGPTSELGYGASPPSGGKGPYSAYTESRAASSPSGPAKTKITPPSARREAAPVAAAIPSSSESTVGSAPSGDMSNGPPSSPNPESTAFSEMEMNWAVPPKPFGPGRLSMARRQPGEPIREAAPAPLSSSNESPNVAPLEYKDGELSHYEANYEHGAYNRETEEQGFEQPENRGTESRRKLAPVESLRRKPQGGMGRAYIGYPYDYTLLTGQYPPGTYTHSSQSFEQGRDHWQDAHYIKYYYPASASVDEAQTPVAEDFQTVQQSPQRTGYDQSGAVAGKNPTYSQGQKVWMQG